MRRFIIILSILIFSFGLSISSDVYPNTEVQLQVILQQLEQAGGITRNDITISVKNDNSINAAASYGHIEVNTGLIKLAKSDPDLLVFVIGHELGHIIYKQDVPPKIFMQNKKFELEADSKGAELTQAAGYDVCGSVRFFKILQKKYGDNGGKVHPNFSVRIKNLDKYGCS